MKRTRKAVMTHVVMFVITFMFLFHTHRAIAQNDAAPNPPILLVWTRGPAQFVPLYIMDRRVIAEDPFWFVYACVVAVNSAQHFRAQMKHGDTLCTVLIVIDCLTGWERK